jgi:hypothetical protein
MSDTNLALTAKGQALMAKIALGNGTIPLEITRIVTSSEAAPDPLNSTALVAEEQQFSIIGKQTIGARSIIRTYLNNFGNPLATPPVPALAQGYPLVQIGFYATDPDEGEILMRISQFDNPNYVPAISERAWEFEPTFNFVTGNASSVIIQIDPAASVSRTDIWDSVNISNAPPNALLGVRTQYMVERNSPEYAPYQPDSGLTLQGTFDPTTGLDDEGEPIPAPDITNDGFYWTASVAGTFTPPGGSTPLTFAVGDWLTSDGTAFAQSPPQTSGSSFFAGARITEIRVISDPSNPNGSAYEVALPITILSAVIDPVTRHSLLTILSNSSGILDGHIGNTDVHVTAAWKASILGAINDLIAFTQQTDIFVTPEQVAAWNAAISTANAALAMAQENAGNLTDIEGRIGQIEDSLWSGITSNPFSISFEDLSGIVVTYGVWNQILRRIEC